MIEPRPLPPEVAALEARLGIPEGALADEDLARATAALEDASALVLAEAPARIAEEWETSGAKPIVHSIVLKAARREYENPRGLNAETMGEHTVQISTSSGVYLTDREIAVVRRAATGRKGGGYVGSIQTPSAYLMPPLPANIDDWGEDG
jgi:hypothetical protein